MFKVEVYPSDKNGVVPSQPAAVHYACLAAAASNESGRIWSMGRKQGDYCCGQDKSVSREHVELCVVSANKTLTTGSSSSDKEEEEQEEHSSKPGPCVTPDQVQACQTASDQMCLVLRNLGKFGSFLVVSDDDTDKNKKKKDSDDDNNSDSDTANTEEVAQSQAVTDAAAADVTMSEISKKYIHNNSNIKKAKLQHVRAGGSVVLLPNSANTTTSSTPAVFQCGKMGTTVVVTRLYLRFVASGGAALKKDLAKLLAQSFYTIGATVSDELFEDGDETADSDEPQQDAIAKKKKGSSTTTTTYLVTEKYNACLKQLTAWSTGNIPFCTLDFCQALLDRKSAADPFPSASNFAPASDGNDFWTSAAPRRHKLWRSCVLLATSPKDAEYKSLVQAAGGRVVPLYNVDTGTALSSDDEALAMVEEEQKKEKTACFAVNTRRKLTKILKDQYSIPTVPNKEFALAIVHQRLLQDGHGNSIGFEVTDSDSSEDDDDNKSPPSVPADKSETNKTTSQVESAAPTKGSSAVATKPNDGEPTAADSRSSRKKRSRDEDDDDASSKEPSNNKKAAVTKKSQDKPTAAKTKKKKKDNNDDDEEIPAPDGDVEMAEDDAAKKQVEPPVQAAKENSGSKDKHSDTAPPAKPQQPRPKRKPLDTSKGGWMAALPQGDKRKKYLRSKSEIQELTGIDEVRAAAPTDFVKGLVVLSNSSSSSGDAAATATASSSSSAGPNFKAFRKNTVPPVHTTYVTLRSVLPKESEHQRDMEEQRQAMEEQQRRADELFRDTGGGGSKGRRRGRR